MPRRPRGQTLQSAVIPNSKQEACWGASFMLSDGSEAYINMISYHNDAFVVPPWKSIRQKKRSHNAPHNITEGSICDISQIGGVFSPLLTFSVQYLSDEEANIRSLYSSLGPFRPLLPSFHRQIRNFWLFRSSKVDYRRCSQRDKASKSWLAQKKAPLSPSHQVLAQHSEEQLKH